MDELLNDLQQLVKKQEGKCCENEKKRYRVAWRSIDPAKGESDSLVSVHDTKKLAIKSAKKLNHEYPNDAHWVVEEKRNDQE